MDYNATSSITQVCRNFPRFSFLKLVCSPLVPHHKHYVIERRRIDPTLLLEENQTYRDNLYLLPTAVFSNEHSARPFAGKASA